MATEDNILEGLIVIVVAILGLFFLNRYLGWVSTIFTVVTIVISLAALAYASPSVKATIVPNTANHREEQGDFFWDTGFYIKNLSRFPVKVFVNLNLQINGTAVTELGLNYRGKELWHLFPYEYILGHFSFKHHPKPEYNKQTKITMAIEIWNEKTLFNCFIKYPARHFELKFEKDKWYWHNTDFGIDY